MSFYSKFVTNQECLNKTMREPSNIQLPLRFSFQNETIRQIKNKPLRVLQAQNTVMLNGFRPLFRDEYEPVRRHIQVDYPIKIPTEVTDHTQRGSPNDKMKSRIPAKLKKAAWVGP